MLQDQYGDCLKCGTNNCEGGCRGNYQQEADNKPITAGGDIADGKMKDWRPELLSANATMKDRNTVVSRNRSMLRDDSFYAGASRSQRHIVVGPNVRVKFTFDYRKLAKLGCEVDRQWMIEQALELRRMWTCDMEDPIRNWSDASQKQTFSHQLGTVHSEWTGAGEVLLVSQPVDNPDSPVTTNWALIDTARLSTPTKYLHREDIHDGIRETKNGAAKIFYIADNHPELRDPTCRYSTRLRSTVLRKAGKKGLEDNWTPFKKFYDWGRPKVIHFFDKDRAQLSRQKPAFASALRPHFMADVYSQAAVDAAVRDAQMAMWIESDDNQILTAFQHSGVDIEEVVNRAYGALNQANSDLYSENQLSLNGSSIPQLPVNSAIKTNQLGSPSDNHPDFMKTMLAYGARALDLSQQTFMGDASDANYSSLRHASVMDWYSRYYQRDLLFNYVGVPIATAWMEDKVARGEFEMPCGGSRARQLQFFLKHRNLFRVKFYGPAQVGIDDLKQYKTLRAKIKDRLLSVEDYYLMYTDKYWEDDHDQMLYEDEVRSELIQEEDKQITLNNNDRDI